MSSERRIQNEIRNALAGHGLFFRANVGRAWTGDQAHKISAQCLQLTNPRPFDTGLPAGFADLFGLVPVTIGPEHVGQTFARFVAVEVKNQSGRLSDRQRAFLDAVAREGGLAGVARSPEDALKIIATGCQS